MKRLLTFASVLVLASSLPVSAQYYDPFNPFSVSPTSPYNPIATNPPGIYGQDGQYLGEYSASPLRPDSINNPVGRYGNPMSPDSPNSLYQRSQGQGQSWGLPDDRNFQPSWGDFLGQR